MTASSRNPISEDVVSNLPRGPSTGRASAPAGSWVEIRQLVLRAGERAPNVPPDTAQTDFVARVRGFLVDAAEIGGPATVATLSDRTVSGELIAVNPRNPADFGEPVPDLLRLGRDARRSLDGSAPEP
jgi:2-amino-4-ketopentanoate thiolase alpha subunit